jgi:hypothetical protein
MDSHQDDEETKDESSGDNTRALVAALTQQLLVGDGGEASQAELQPALRGTEDALLRSTRVLNTGNLQSNELFRPPSSSEDEHENILLPDFLSETSIRAALHRANALCPQGHLSDEPHFPSALGETQPHHLDPRDRGDLATREMVGSQSFAASNPPLYSPASQRFRAPAHERSGVPARFVPGHETESVLKITKRPRLRPKDVSHRRSLGTGEPGNLLPTDASSPLGWPQPLSPSDGFPVARDSLVGLFPSTVQASHFIVVLAFGQSRVSVPGSPYMPVATLRLTAGAICDRDPELAIGTRSS